MTGLEIALLVIGIMIMIASFIFSTDKQKTETEAVVTGELSEKQKEEIDRQIKEILDDRMDEVKEQTEINLDKLSNRKMLEMNEYSDTILAEINRNHNEVMFLYDMLNEKKKEINIAVRDINIAKKELEKNIAEVENVESVREVQTVKQSKTTKTVKKAAPAKPVIEEMEDTGGFMASENILKEEQKKNILNQLDAVVEAVSDDVQADEEVQTPKKTRKKTSTAKTAAKRTKEAVLKETLRDTRKAANVEEGGNNNERILALSSQGMSQVEIAKELGIGLGEVKLVIDLFRGGRQ
jgi:hypothetical protein